MKLYFLDSMGWPVETFARRPITNLIRLLLHTRKITRKRPACLDAQPGNNECMSSPQ